MLATRRTTPLPGSPGTSGINGSEGGTSTYVHFAHGVLNEAHRLYSIAAHPEPKVERPDADRRWKADIS